MIRLFEKDAVEFNTLGLCVLSDAKSCVVTEELNGEYELTLEYPKNGSHFSDIKKDRIIVCKPNPDDDPEPFRIYQITKEINGISKISAQHISYDLSNYTVREFEEATSLSDALQKIQNGTNIVCPFHFSTDMSSDKKFKIYKPTNLRSVLGGDEPSILQTYEGELKFTNYDVKLLGSRGKDRGFTIRYGKNLKDITQDISFVNDISGVYPFYHSETFEYISQEVKTYKKVYINPGHESDPLASDGLSWYPTKDSTMLELIIPIKTGVAVQFANDPRNGSYINKIVIWDPDINRYREVSEEDYPPNITETSSTPQTVSTTITLEDYEGATNGVIYLQGKSASDVYKKILTLDLSTSFAEVPSQADLKQKAEDYIKEKHLGQVIDSITISFVKMSYNPEYSYLALLEVVKLGDIVKIYYEEFGIENILKIKKTTYNVLSNVLSEVTVGTIQNGITDTVLLKNDNISSLTNNVGYADEAKVTELTAHTITSDYITSTNAHLSEAQIEDLETYKIKCSGIIEASKGSIDELVAKLLIADDAEIKNTLTAGNIKVKGQLETTDGFVNNDFSAGVDNEQEQEYLLSISTKDKKVAIKNADIDADNIDVDSCKFDELKGNYVNTYELGVSRELTIGSVQIDPLYISQEITKSISFTATWSLSQNILSVVVNASENVPENTKVTLTSIINGVNSRYVRIFVVEIYAGTMQGSITTNLESGETVSYVSPPSPNLKTYKISSGYSTGASVSGDWCPIVDNQFNLGNSNLRWQNIYSRNGVVQTSDKAIKKDINYDISMYESLFDDLKPVSYKFKDDKKNETHFGLIAQDVEDSLNKNHVSSNDYALLFKNQNGNENYGLRYNELHALEIYEIQKLKEKINYLEAKLKKNN